MQRTWVVGGVPEPLSQRRLTNARTRDEITPQESLVPCVSPSMRELASRVDTVAVTEAPVLISDEAGTGKSTLAHHIYANSRRRSAPLVILHASEAAGAPFEQLVQPAVRTVLVEEVGELSPDAQSALLRLMTDPHAPPRLIATTSMDLTDMVARGRLRADLLYRLDVVRLNIPPLRERPEDILVLAQHFLVLAAGSFRREVPKLSADAETRLLGHSWPGNVRELGSCILESVLQCSGASVRAADLRLRIPAGPEVDLADILSRLRAVDPRDLYQRTDRLVLQWALDRSSGNHIRAASLLGIGRNSFRTKVRRYGLAPSAPPGQETGER